MGESVARAREEVERILLQLHRKKGCFNAPLEEKFKEKDAPQATPMQVDPSYAALQQRDFDFEADGALGAEAPESRQLPPAQQQRIESPPSMASAGVLPIPATSILPMSSEDLLKWASHYANDSASVALYMRLKRAGVPLV